MFLNSHDARATAQEVSGIVIGVEANHVALENAVHDLGADWKDSVDLATGKGSVKEEADLDVLLLVPNLLPKHCRQEHQVIVVHPNHVVVLDIFSNGLCEEEVGFTVRLPRIFLKGHIGWMVVQQWPQD